MRVSDTIAAKWLERALRSYPEGTARFLREARDPFRNPVGHTLRGALEILTEEVLGEMRPERLDSALDSAIRIRAVQDFSARDAVAFVFPLREILREEGLGELETRVDELALRAFDHYMRCREQLWEIQSRWGRSAGVRPVSRPVFKEGP